MDEFDVIVYRCRDLGENPTSDRLARTAASYHSAQSRCSWAHHKRTASDTTVLKYSTRLDSLATLFLRLHFGNASEFTT